MKSNSLKLGTSIEKDILWLLRNTLRNPDLLYVACDSRDTPVPGLSHRGIHHHEDWEVFCVMRGTLNFVVAGRLPMKFTRGSVLVVPPECLHAVSSLSQPDDLCQRCISIPGTTGNSGGMDGEEKLAKHYPAFPPGPFAKWTELLGETPGAVMEKAMRLAAESEWGREHALGLLRTIFSTYAEMSTSSQNRNESAEQRVSEALLFLHSYYVDADLFLSQVAAKVGLSVSRFSSLFRKITGHSVQQTLIDIRLRRAMTLIKQSSYSIKEVAHLTGWTNQLYFSGAFRKRYKFPPSHFQKM